MESWRRSLTVRPAVLSSKAMETGKDLQTSVWNPWCTPLSRIFFCGLKTTPRPRPIYSWSKDHPSFKTIFWWSKNHSSTKTNLFTEQRPPFFEDIFLVCVAQKPPFFQDQFFCWPDTTPLLRPVLLLTKDHSTSKTFNFCWPKTTPPLRPFFPCWPKTIYLLGKTTTNNNNKKPRHPQM